jgi:hypothetical protein
MQLLILWKCRRYLESAAAALPSDTSSAAHDWVKAYQKKYDDDEEESQIAADTNTAFAAAHTGVGGCDHDHSAVSATAAEVVVGARAPGSWLRQRVEAPPAAH